MLPEACCCCWGCCRAGVAFLGLATPENELKPMADMSISVSDIAVG